MSYLSSFVKYAFYGIVLVLSILIHEPPSLIPTPSQGRDLWNGTSASYILPGSEMALFKPLLPERGTVGFLTDQDFGKVVKDSEFYHAAQNFLAPLVLNPHPAEPIALLYASSGAAADKRLSETGYRFAAAISEGKGVIIKQ